MTDYTKPLDDPAAEERVQAALAIARLLAAEDEYTADVVALTKAKKKAQASLQKVNEARAVVDGFYK